MKPRPVTSMPWLDPAWKLVLEWSQAGRLAHALMVRGPEGIGKTGLAQTILAWLLCLEPGEEGACGRCRSCSLLRSGAHPDAFRLDPPEGKKEIQVGQVRKLIQSLGLTTTISTRKAALIAPADQMNRNAANALLKTLEEPPGETVLILVTHDASRLPVTVRSRCQAVTCALPEPEQAAEWLAREGGLSPNDARDALQAASGSPLKALAYQRQELVPVYQALREALDGLWRGQVHIPSVLGLLNDQDPEMTWLWLSGISAGRLRDAGLQRRPPAALAHLQRQADAHRLLVRKPVRRDLLLHDWLIEWARAGAETG